MTALRLHHSNRIEALAADLAHLMRADPGDPFAPERIIVPHPTIGRWLSLELARELGIAANIRFEQPAEFAWSIMRDVMPDLAREQPYEPARLRWRIHDLLPGPAGEGGRHTAGTDPVSASPRPSDSGDAARVLESALGAYLRDGDRRKRFELADRLARMYDQCLLYRARLDPCVGERRRSPLAGAAVAAPDRNGRSGRRRSLGRRPREIPPDRPGRFRCLHGARPAARAATRGAAAWSPIAAATASAGRRRFPRTSELAPASEFLCCPGALAFLPRAALRSGPGHRSPSVPAQSMQGVLGRHPHAPRDGPSSRWRGP